MLVFAYNYICQTSINPAPSTGVPVVPTPSPVVPTSPAEQMIPESDQSFIPDQAFMPEDITATTVYRKAEKQRILAALLAGGSILLAGSEGTGKTVVAIAVVEELKSSGFDVAYLEPATPKQWLLNLTEQLAVDNTDISGKALTIDGMKDAIAVHLKQSTAFLVIDDAHSLESKTRVWLKYLKRSRQPMLLVATDPPRTDIFLNTPPLILQPLPEHCIRDLMEKTAIQYGIPLHARDFARLQSQSGGNPTLAIRAIEQEYLGLTVESSDEAKHYFDITPLLFFIGTMFVMLRFFALGSNNPLLYILAGSLAALTMGLSRLFYTLPKDSKRIT